MCASPRCGGAFCALASRAYQALPWLTAAAAKERRRSAGVLPPCTWVGTLLRPTHFLSLITRSRQRYLALVYGKRQPCPAPPGFLPASIAADARLDYLRPRVMLLVAAPALAKPAEPAGATIMQRHRRRATGGR